MAGEIKEQVIIIFKNVRGRSNLTKIEKQQIDAAIAYLEDKKTTIKPSQVKQAEELLKHFFRVYTALQTPHNWGLVEPFLREHKLATNVVPPLTKESPSQTRKK